jgi:hypothetical protein
LWISSRDFCAVYRDFERLSKKAPGLGHYERLEGVWNVHNGSDQISLTPKK